MINDNKEINANYQKELLEKANKIAEKALIRFYEKLGLDSKLCTDVNNINPKIGECPIRYGKKALAHYDTAYDEITIDTDYLNKMTKSIINAPAQLKEKQDAIVAYNIAATIIHERIHALRRIRTPKNIIPIENYYSLARNTYINEFGESADYTIPCDVLLDIHSSITDPKDLCDILTQQDCLEDAVTEALAQIITYNAVDKFSNLSINQLANKVMKDESDFIVAGAKIVQTMDENMLTNFITTRYQKTPYQDLFYEMFAENYYILLSDIEQITIAANNKDFPPKNILEEFDKIILSYKTKNNKTL